VLDKEEILAGREVPRVGRFEFIFIRIVIVYRKGGNLEIVVADDPELESVPGMAGCDAMDENGVSVGNGNRVRRGGFNRLVIESTCRYCDERNADDE
jgi:hypothetical protein